MAYWPGIMMLSVYIKHKTAVSNIMLAGYLSPQRSFSVTSCHDLFVISRLLVISVKLVTDQLSDFHQVSLVAEIGEISHRPQYIPAATPNPQK